MRAGMSDMAPQIAEEVRWVVRGALARPPIEFPRWRLADAAAALTQVTLTPEMEPPKPQVRRGTHTHTHIASQYPLTH